MLYKTRVRKWQLWERKKDGVQVRVISGKGNEWKTIRPNNGNICHHMTAWNLNKDWKLVEK